MGHLMLRHDQDLQATAQQDTFILYLVPSQEGSIPLLQAAGAPSMDGPEGENLHPSIASSPEADGLQRTGPTPGHHGEEWNSPRGPDLAVYPMGSQAQQASFVQNQDANAYDGGSGDARGTPHPWS